MALTDYKVSETYSGRDIASLSDRPNQDGLTAAQLKARFDQLGKEVIPNYNDLIDFIEANLFSGGSTNTHTHNVDNLEDGTVNRNYTQTDKTKLDGIATGAEVNQNAFSNVKVGSTTIPSTTKTDTIELVAGLNITMTVDVATKKVFLSATGDLATEAVQSLIVDIGNYYEALNVEDALQEIGAILYPSLAKTTPVDADTMLIVDSESSNIFKKLTWANIKATLKTYFDTVYFNYTHPTGDGNLHVPANSTTNNNKVLKANGTAGSYSWTNLGTVANGLTAKATPIDADSIMIVDSAASNVGKKTTFTELKAFLKTYFDTLYQTILVSGTNIKTINGNSVLGSGDVELLPKNNPIATGLFDNQGGQIKFPTTPNLSTDAHTLDAYKEGSYNPTVTSSGGTITTYTATAAYTRIGRLVNLNAFIELTNAGSATGSLIFTLPFTSQSNSIGCGKETELTALMVMASCGVGGTTAAIVKYDATTIIATGRKIRVSISYDV